MEVLGSQIGSFNEEFWVKTEPLRRVKLIGVFIAPRIVIEYPISKFDLTMVDFPRTYYGAECFKTVVICNNSSTDRMFCMVSERGKELEVNTVMMTLIQKKNYIFSSDMSPIMSVSSRIGL